MTAEEQIQDLAAWLAKAGMPDYLKHHVIQGGREVIYTAITESNELRSLVPTIPISMLELEGMILRWQGATPGPWIPVEDTVQTVTHKTICVQDHQFTYNENWDNDSVFIAAAPDSIRQLLAHVSYLEGLLQDMSQDGTLAAYNRGYKDGYAAAEEKAHEEAVKQ